MGFQPVGNWITFTTDWKSIVRVDSFPPRPFAE
jgi:hypothetical protein